MMITKKALSRRTVLKALGATMPLPFLDAMVPAMTALAQTPAQRAAALRRGLRAQRRHSRQVVSGRRRRGLRVLADAEAARGVSRSAARHQRPRQRAAAAARRAAVQQPRRRQHALPDRRDAEPQPARRRVDRSDRGARSLSRRHDAAVARARAGIGGLGHVLRLRPQLRLHRHHRLGRTDLAAADGTRPERRVRAAVRRRRQQRCARRGGRACSSKGSILDSLLGEVAACSGKVAADRSDADRRLSGQRARRRAAHPARGRAQHRAAGASIARPACPRPSSSTPG